MAKETCLMKLLISVLMLRLEAVQNFAVSATTENRGVLHGMLFSTGESVLRVCLVYSFVVERLLLLDTSILQ